MRTLTLLVTGLVTIAVTGCTDLLPDRLFNHGSCHLVSMPPLRFDTGIEAQVTQYGLDPSVLVKAQAGDASAQEEVGHAYLLARDYDNAQRWLERSVKAGFPLAHYDLAHLYLAQSTEKSATLRAIALLLSAHKAGIAEASLMLGHLYRTGQRISPNPKQAFAFYRSAANRGLPEGAYRLGKCYLTGFGTQKNLPQAQFWLDKACALAVPNACMALKATREEDRATPRTAP